MKPPSELSNNDVVVGDVSEGPGAALRAARESLGITCREVAEALNLSLRAVEAIEVNDYENLPAPVFTRGYIRAYAKLLELDPDPLVARYLVEDRDDATREDTSLNSLQDLIRRYPERVIGGGGVVLLILFGLVILALWPLFRPDAVKPAEQSMTVPGGTVEQVASNVPPRKQKQDSQKQETLEPDTVEATQPSVRDSQTQSDLLDSPGSVQRISALGDDRLWFKFSDECWVEVLSTTGENLYSDLSRAGQTLELVGGGPFRILLGYAPGVRMAFNGEPVVLGPHTRNNVASLVLGQ